MANLKLIAKIGVPVVLVVIILAVLIGVLTKKSSVKEVGIQIDPTVDIDETVFDENILKCLEEHSKTNYYPVNRTSIPCHPSEKCMVTFLSDLSQILTSFNISLKLLEPDLLFCLLPSSRRFNLLTRGFSPNRFLGSKNVVTFGVSESEAKILEGVNVMQKFLFSGYGISEFKRYLKFEDNSVEFSRFLIMKGDLLIHVIELHSRASYLWFPSAIHRELGLNGMLYKNDTMFENFNTSSVHLDSRSNAKIFLPSDTRYFLLDMMTSIFLECKAVSNTSTEVNEDVLTAIKQLKEHLTSHMVSFWLWSKSLQGWFEKCDILHYTSELKFSVAAKSVTGFNFTALFSDSECEHIETTLNLNSTVKSVQIKCHEVVIDLIFVYEEDTSFWYEYVNKHNTYKLKIPKFSLCATDIYGQKIAIPCNTDEIFEGEYGKFLRNETLNLDPETMKNVQLIDTR